MPHDPALVSETREWLRKAATDIRAGEFELGAEPSLAEDIVFHAQQAAEKSLKGFLTWSSRPFPKTHSLEALGSQCIEVDSTLHQLIDRCVPLTEYAWKFRYPGAPEEPTVDEAMGALTLAREVYEAIIERLPADVRPRGGR